MAKDAVCNGTGFLWVDPYGNSVLCWRCVGTGEIPNTIPVKENGKISPLDQQDEDATL